MLKILGWALVGLLLFVFVLLLLPVRTRVRFDGALQVWAGLGPVSLRVFPMKKKPKSEKEKTQAAEKKAAKKAKKASKPKTDKPKQKLTLEIICDYIRLGVEALGMLRRRLVLSNLTCHLKVASKDAAGTALLYGRVAAAVSAVYPVLEQNLRIKKTDIAVDADFESEKLEILIDITLAVCPLRLLIAGVILLFQFLKIYRKSKRVNQPTEEKGGKLHEQHQRSNELDDGKAPSDGGRQYRGR